MVSKCGSSVTVSLNACTSSLSETVTTIQYAWRIASGMRALALSMLIFSVCNRATSTDPFCFLSSSFLGVSSFMTRSQAR